MINILTALALVWRMQIVHVDGHDITQYTAEPTPRISLFVEMVDWEDEPPFWHFEVADCGMLFALGEAGSRAEAEALAIGALARHHPDKTCTLK